MLENVVQAPRIRASRRVRHIADGWISIIVLAMLGCDADSHLAGEAADAAAPRPPIEDRIDERVQDWILLLETPDEVPPGLVEFLGHPDFSLKLRDETIRGRENLFDWAASQKQRLFQIDREIGPIEISQEEPDRLRVEFDVDRSGRDESDVLHLSRTHHSWLVRIGEQGTPQLLEAEALPALPHPGTGTRVLCL